MLGLGEFFLLWRRPADDLRTTQPGRSPNDPQLSSPKSNRHASSDRRRILGFRVPPAWRTIFELAKTPADDDQPLSESRQNRSVNDRAVRRRKIVAGPSGIVAVNV